MQDNLELKGKKEIIINNIKIILDPKLSIKQNANKYYQKYTKKKKVELKMHTCGVVKE